MSTSPISHSKVSKMTAIFCENQHGAKWLRAYHTVVRQVFLLRCQIEKKNELSSSWRTGCDNNWSIVMHECWTKKKSGLTTAKNLQSRGIFGYKKKFSSPISIIILQIKEHGKFNQKILEWCFEMSCPSRYWPVNYDLYFKWKLRYH